MMLGLRVDVDTLFGLSRGVPRLLSLLDELNLKATFFLPMGPDRMGRNAKRIAKERGLVRSLVSYSRIYSWQTLLAGTVVEAADFSQAGVKMMSKIKRLGHDVGIHSFDHFRWQNSISEFSRNELVTDFRRCIENYRSIFREMPRCCAAPGWKATELSLSVEDGFGFDYASDTRGFAPFYPVFNGMSLKTLQVPVTLPTLDELILQGKSSLVLPSSGSHVYCAHAEVEGLSRLEWFSRFLRHAIEDGIPVVSLSALAQSVSDAFGCAISNERMPGRSSAVAVQVRDGKER